MGDINKVDILLLGLHWIKMLAGHGGYIAHKTTPNPLTIKATPQAVRYCLLIIIQMLPNFFLLF